MVFRLRPEILEDDLLHEPLHQVPVLHYPMTDRPLPTKKKNNVNISAFKQEAYRSTGAYLCSIRRLLNGFISNEKVQIVDSSHHPALGLIAHLGGLFDCNTWRTHKQGRRGFKAPKKKTNGLDQECRWDAIKLNLNQTSLTNLNDRPKTENLNRLKGMSNRAVLSSSCQFAGRNCAF